MTAKDSRYSCLVLFMSFLSHVCHLGFSYGVVGNLTIAHQQAFNISLQQSSLLGSVFVATFYLLGPASSIIVKKLGCRPTELLGGGLSIVSLGLCSLATKFWHVFILFSVLTGFGMSLCLSSSTEVLPQHFDKYRNLAFAIASSGVMVGVIIWPIASQYFLSIYSYSKAIGIIAAFQIIHSLAGLTFISGNREDVTKEKPGETSANGVLSANNDQVAVSTVCKDERHSPSQESSEKTKVTSEGELPPPQSQSLRKSFTTLLKSYNVWFLLIHAMLRMGGSTIFAVMINKYVIAAVGLTSGEAAFGITLTGGGSLIGCVLVAATGTIKYDRVILHTCVVALNAVMTIILAYITSKPMYYSIATLWGVWQGATLATLLPVVHIVSGFQHQAILFGMVLFSQGLGSVLMTQVYVYIGQATSFRYSLVAAGVGGISVSFLLIPQIFQNRKCQNTVT